jgi:hypothetical protein
MDDATLSQASSEYWGAYRDGEPGDAERQAQLDEDTATGRELERDNAAEQTETRFTMGLIGEVAAVLDAHGYHQSADPGQVSRFVGQLVSLTRAYEGGQG